MGRVWAGRRAESSSTPGVTRVVSGSREDSATREDCSDSFSIRGECRVYGGGPVERERE